MIIGINASFLRKPDSGIGQVTRNFLVKLAKLQATSYKLQVRFILYLEEDVDLNLPENFEKRICLPNFYKRDDLIRKVIWEKYLLPRKVKEDKCDVLFSMYQSATILQPVTYNLQPKHVMLVHDTVWKIFPEYLNNFRKKVYYNLVDKAIKKADKIMTVSENSKKDIIKYFNILTDKVRVNYIDCDEIFKNQKSKIKSQNYNSKLKINDNLVSTNYKLQTTNYIFYVGGFDVRKNVGKLIEAYGMLWSKFRNQNSKLKVKQNTGLKGLGPSACNDSISSRETLNQRLGNKKHKIPLSPPSLKGEVKGTFPDLILAGKFNSHLVPLVTNIPEEIEKVCKKYNLPEEKIIQLGFVKQKELPILYKNAKLFCYPSLYEGFGLPILEAMNCDVPIVTGNNSSISEVCSENSVMLINTEDANKISEAMYDLLTNPDIIQEKVENAKEEAKKFNWDKFVENFLGLM